MTKKKEHPAAPESVVALNRVLQACYRHTDYAEDLASHSLRYDLQWLRPMVEDAPCAAESARLRDMVLRSDDYAMPVCRILLTRAAGFDDCGARNVTHLLWMGSIRDDGTPSLSEEDDVAGYRLVRMLLNTFDRSDMLEPWLLLEHSCDDASALLADFAKIARSLCGVVAPPASAADGWVGDDEVDAEMATLVVRERAKIRSHGL